MEEQKQQKAEQKLREFTEEERDWMERSLAVMPPKLAARAFLDTFWDFAEHTDLKPEEVERRVYQSFKQARYDKNRLSYAEIQKRIEELQDVFMKYADLYPLMNPFERLNELERLRQRGDLTPSQRFKLLAIFEKIFESLYFTEEGEENRGHNPFHTPIQDEDEDE